jgi:hypothetical protein
VRYCCLFLVLQPKSCSEGLALLEHLFVELVETEQPGFGLKEPRRPKEGSKVPKQATLQEPGK